MAKAKSPKQPPPEATTPAHSFINVESACPKCGWAETTPVGPPMVQTMPEAAALPYKTITRQRVNCTNCGQTRMEKQLS